MAKASKEIIQKHEQMFYPTVRVRTKKAGGSGTVVYSKKYKDEVYTYVITNHHVIADSVKIEKKWEELIKIRDICIISIEEKRASKEIGSSLEADVQIYLGEEYLKLVKDVNLSEYFITSKANGRAIINDDKLFKLEHIANVSVLVKKAKGKKCSRCWKILESPCDRNNCGLKN